MNKMQTYVILK